MDRRTALKQVTFLMGGTLATPIISGVLSGCQASGDPKYAPVFLSPEQYKLTGIAVDKIIPRTSTPGALDVGVPEFIDLILNDVFKPKEQQLFLTGLASLNHEKPFSSRSDEEQVELLREMEAEAYAKKKEGNMKDAPFFLILKQLTLTGYFTSEQGMKEALAFLAIPGKLEACIPYEEGTKAWAI